MIKYVTFLVGSSFFICGVIYFNWVFSESLYFEKTSLKYHLLISNEIKEIPFFKKSKKETYYYSSGDGAAPGVQAVSYYSDHTREEILQNYKKYFTSKKNGMIKLKSNKYVVKLDNETNVYMFFINNNEITIEYYW